MKPEAIHQLDIFSSLNSREFSRVLYLMKHHEVHSGWNLFVEGDEGHHLYIVLSGTVSILIRDEDENLVEVSRVSGGSFFGEMSIIAMNLRSATCRTLDECKLLSLSKNSFIQLLSEEPHAAIKIMQYMLNTAVNRLHTTGAFVSDMVRWGEEARVRAVTDMFTGFYNRRFFDEALKDSIVNSSVSNTVVNIIMLDIDHFGSLNSEYGEEVGDQVIKSAVEVFRGAFGEDDILARYGGDEFAFIVPKKNETEILEICRNINEKIRKMDILNQYEGSFNHISVSMGIAASPDHGDSDREILNCADKALYTAKENGRDCAVFYS